MSDCYGAVRSNWFVPIDVELFCSWFEEKVIFDPEASLLVDGPRVAIGGEGQYPSAWPKRWTEDNTDLIDWSLEVFAEEFFRLVSSGQTITILATGNEKLRYCMVQRLVLHDGKAHFEEWFAGD